MTVKPPKKPNSPFPDVTPGVVYSPHSMHSFQQGIAAIVDAVRPTLGPQPRLVAVARTHASDAPELLDDGGLIARRIIALTNRDADMGAMFVRHVLWKLREEVGDGTATAAVMLKSIYDEGLKYIMAGGNAMLLREGLESLLPGLLKELDRMAQPIQSQDSLNRFAASTCPDAETANLLGEIFFIIGEDGHLEVKNARGQNSEREYIEGSFWESGLASLTMVNDPKRLLARLENAAILITDLEINSAKDLVPVLQAASDAGFPSLAVFARKFSEDASALLVNASRSGRLPAVGVKMPGTGQSDQYNNMQDLVTLCGGRSFISGAGDTLDSIQPQDFGHARRLWADQEYLGIVGGKGDPLNLRRQIASLKRAIQVSDSADSRRKLRIRLGRLNGGAARLLVGGQTESEHEHLKEQAERASNVIRSALHDGILPGGGAAFLTLRDSLCPDNTSNQTIEQTAARRILARALEQPARAIIANAGYQMHGLPPGFGFDVRTGQPADMHTAGIYDAAGVQKAALVAAVKGAALALTVDILVHHARPQFSAEP